MEAHEEGGGRDVMKKDLQAVQVGDDWYSVAQDRGKWRSAGDRAWSNTERPRDTTVREV